MTRKHRQEREGLQFTHPKYGEYVVVQYSSSADVTVKFKGTGSLVNTQFGNILYGRVKDREAKSVFGVGIIGDTLLSSYGKMHKSYVVWHSMLGRCYSEKIQADQPTYRGCSVCEEWLYYPNFKLWFDENYVEGYELDKDIKESGNKVYSPNTCTFVLGLDNKLEAMRHKMYTIIVRGPCGKEYVVHNQPQFCIENSIINTNFSKMVNGGRKTCQGYTLVRRLSSEEAEELTKEDL